jgi:hypothetical protein
MGQRGVSGSGGASEGYATTGRIAACHMNAIIEHKMKLEGREGTQRETRRADKGQTREESAGKLKTTEIERTWKLELLRATASFEQHNAVVL